MSPIHLYVDLNRKQGHDVHFTFYAAVLARLEGQRFSFTAINAGPDGAKSSIVNCLHIQC